MQIGLKGEELGLSSGNSQWVTQPALPTKQPLIWYKVTSNFGWLAIDELSLTKYGIHNIIKPYVMILPVLL